MTTEQLFITRKRKKWKFAHFTKWPNCFELQAVTPPFWQEYFTKDQPLRLEIGAGTADLSVDSAEHWPNDNFVAIDVKSDRLYHGAKHALEQQLKNIAFLRAHAADLPTAFAPASIKEIWITFPDPFPREKQAKHRLTHPKFLELYKMLLVPGGVVRFKTDSRELFLWSLEQIVAAKWRICELSFDLHQSELPNDYKLTTFYERRFMQENVPINYASFIVEP